VWEGLRAAGRIGGEAAVGVGDVMANVHELVADIHDRMPVILAAGDYVRWLGEEPDPRNLTRPFPGQPDADVADLDASQQAGERRPVDCGAV
jgi:putative SOS response-associated peptidase YedK